MRILHVTEVTHGGVISLATMYAEHQAAAGHDVHALTAPSVEAPRGAVSHPWNPVRRRPTSLARAERTLRAVVARVRPDVVHLHSFFPGLLGRMRRLEEVAVVYQPHSYAFQAVARPLGPLVAVLERRGARHTTAVIVNCTDERDEGLRHGVGAPASVVGLPVDTEHFRPRAGSLTEAKAQLGLADHRLVVSLGRISRQKGQARLAAQWERSAPSGAVYVVVGPGNPTSIAAAAPTSFGKTIRCVGPQDDVRPWLWAADVVVQPSLYEGQSVAMAEALACGVPMVMTEVNGAREAIAPEGDLAAGAVVPVGDMSRALEEVRLRLHDAGVVSVEAGVARRRAKRLFDVDAVMSRVEGVYEHALRSR